MYKIHVFIFETYCSSSSLFDSPPKIKSNFIIVFALTTDGQMYVTYKAVDYAMLTQTIVFFESTTTTTKTFLTVPL
jgi:hypothetical protein